MPSRHAATVARTHDHDDGRKFFTIDEANRALVYLTPVTRDLMTCYVRVVDIRRRIEHPGADDSREHLEAEYETAMDQLSDLVDELHHVGVELKDFERGLIDFPAQHSGRDIFYSWEFGEQIVQTWHEVDAPFGVRQELKTLLPRAKARDRAA